MPHAIASSGIQEPGAGQRQLSEEIEKGIWSGLGGFCNRAASFVCLLLPIVAVTGSLLDGTVQLRPTFNPTATVTIRLVQSIGSRHKGGAQRFFLRLAVAMEQKGVQHDVIVKRGGWTEDQLRSLPVKNHSLPFGGALDLITPVRYPQLLHRARANVVMSQLERATKRTPRGPWIYVARLGGYYELKDYRHCDYLVGNTPGCLDFFRSGGWPDERIQYIPNFVPGAELCTKPEQRADHDTPEGVPLIVWVGRMERDKGPDIVIRALKHVPGAYLWMVGGGPLDEELKALAAELDLMDRIRFLGWLDNVHPALQAADAFVIASRFEVLGNVVLEAWSHRVPVVAVRSPGPEHLIEDGENGLLVPNEDPEAMAAAFNKIIASPHLAAKLGEAGYGEMRSVYSEEAVVGQYCRFFERILDRSFTGRTADTRQAIGR